MPGHVFSDFLFLVLWKSYAITKAYFALLKVCIRQTQETQETVMMLQSFRFLCCAPYQTDRLSLIRHHCEGSVQNVHTSLPTNCWWKAGMWGRFGQKIRNCVTFAQLNFNVPNLENSPAPCLVRIASYFVKVRGSGIEDWYGRADYWFDNYKHISLILRHIWNYFTYTVTLIVMSHMQIKYYTKLQIYRSV